MRRFQPPSSAVCAASRRPRPSQSGKYRPSVETELHIDREICVCRVQRTQINFTRALALAKELDKRQPNNRHKSTRSVTRALATYSLAGVVVGLLLARISHFG
jgi:hypothetical protein